MNDGVDSIALDDFVERVAVANVALDEREPLVVRQRLEVGQVTRVGERIQPDDHVAQVMLDPVVDEVRADESGRPCHQHSTHCSLCLRSYPLCVLGQTIPGRGSSANGPTASSAKVPDDARYVAHC